MERPVFAANWKMNHGPSAARAFATDFAARWTPRSDRTVIFFPPALSVTTVVDALSTRLDLAVGVQNIWTEDKGAFTGENSAPMSRDAGVRFVLVGHSERRHVFGETDDQTALKCAAAVRSGLTPVLCVGELLPQREAGQTEAVVLAQLEAGVAKLSSADIAAMAIAYEPVWAIGTGKTATPQDASIVHAGIRRALKARVGDAAADVPILYGGSVNTANAAALLAAPGVNGLLVGGASLLVDDWLRICGT
jgi:triosephosphate isomerase (TIM)